MTTQELNEQILRDDAARAIELAEFEAFLMDLHEGISDLRAY
jgi:hypothetical protein